MKRKDHVLLWGTVLVALVLPWFALAVAFGGGPGWLPAASALASPVLLVAVVWWVFGKVNSPKL